MTPTIIVISGDSRLTKPPTRDRISKAWIESHHQLNLNQLAHSNFNNHISERGPLCREHRGSLPSLRVSGFIRIYNSHSYSSHMVASRGFTLTNTITNNLCRDYQLSWHKQEARDLKHIRISWPAQSSDKHREHSASTRRRITEQQSRNKLT